jgi:phenylacetate-CoA ligase
MAKDAWDALDNDDLRRLVDRRLRRQVRFQLYAFSPRYRRMLDELGIQEKGFGGVADLSKIPFTSRRDLAAAPGEFVLKTTEQSVQRWGSGSQLASVFVGKLFRGIELADGAMKHEYRPVTALESSGSSGEALRVEMTRRDLAVLSEQGRRMLAVAGVNEDDVVLNLLEPHPSGAFWPVWLGCVALGATQVAPGPVEAAEAAEAAAGATVVVGRAEDLLAIAEASGGSMGVRVAILDPEPAGPAMRERLADAAAGATKIIETYRFAEGRAVWSECYEGAGAGPAGAGFHLSPDFDLIEIVSSEGNAVAPGRDGEIVYTGLDQRGTALMRYKPGDVAFGGLAPGPCPHCGRNVARIIGPVRRRESVVEVQLAGLERIAFDVESLAEALAHPGLSAWEVELAKAEGSPAGSDEVYVLFEPRAGRDPAEVAVDLDKALQARLGFSPTQLVLSDRAAKGVVDKRPSRDEISSNR